MTSEQKAAATIALLTEAIDDWEIRETLITFLRRAGKMAIGDDATYSRMVAEVRRHFGVPAP